MARLRLSPLISAAAGPVGGVCFSANAQGSVAYARPRRRRAAPAVHLNPQGAFAACLHYWRSTVTTSQKEAWSSQAPLLRASRFPQNRSLVSGWNAFLLFNQVRAANSLTLSASPPPIAERYPSPDFYSDFANSIAVRTWFTRQAIVAGEYCILYMSRPCSPGVMRPLLDYFNKHAYAGPQDYAAYWFPATPHFVGSYIWFAHAKIGPDRYPSHFSFSRAPWI